MLQKEKSFNLPRGKIFFILPLIAFITMSFTDEDSSSVSSVDNATNLIVNPLTPSICPISPDLLLKTTSPFGKRVHPIYGRVHFHKGVDLAVRVNTPVIATADGTVLYAGYDRENGNFLVLQHDDGYLTAYYNLAKFTEREQGHLAVGDSVVKGEVIALAGNTGRSTGPHLHYEVIKDGEHQNPESYYNIDDDTSVPIINSYNTMLLTFKDDSLPCDSSYTKPKINSYRGKVTKKREFLALYNHCIKSQAKTEVGEAVVVLEITVRADGSISKIVVLEETPSGYGYGDFLKEWIWDVKFTPAVKDGKRITAKTTETVTIK